MKFKPGDLCIAKNVFLPFAGLVEFIEYIDEQHANVQLLNAKVFHGTIITLAVKKLTKYTNL